MQYPRDSVNWASAISDDEVMPDNLCEFYLDVGELARKHNLVVTRFYGMRVRPAEPGDYPDDPSDS